MVLKPTLSPTGRVPSKEAGLSSPVSALRRLLPERFGQPGRASSHRHSVSAREERSIDGEDSDVQVPPFPNVVHLDVGGHKYTTSIHTLRRVPESRLSQMFTGDIPCERDGSGTFYIDRDGRSFRHILVYLRDYMPPVGLGPTERLELLRESQFYGLIDLHEVLGGVHDPHEASVMLVNPEPPFTRATSSSYGDPTKFNRRQRQAPAPFQAAGATNGSAPDMNDDMQMLLSRYNNGSGPTTPGNSRRGPESFSMYSRPLEPLREAQLRKQVAESHAQAIGYLPPSPAVPQFARLRYGHEYNGDWVVSSPRNLPGVVYELHGACLARSPMEAMNRMSEAGWKPCDFPPKMPPYGKVCLNDWRLIMTKAYDGDDGVTLARCFSAQRSLSPGNSSMGRLPSPPHTPVATTCTATLSSDAPLSL
eukprot:TRINITY_DN11736_c0_g1_i1.p1 TRINITY_DN11736_c0_g1~~TRINITY_DN11736_c0_g1_i1.p1  ORF type:complete len:420 (-),score=52.37 TRINITY_DN11736_c0_g1_i1:39-1298(-)